MKKPLIALLAVFLITACTPMAATRGNILDEYQMKELQPGVDTKDDVVRKIGSLTTVAPFDDNTWYYMGQKTEKRGILDPKIVEERIVAVTFDPADGMLIVLNAETDAKISRSFNVRLLQPGMSSRSCSNCLEILGNSITRTPTQQQLQVAAVAANPTLVYLLKVAINSLCADHMNWLTI